MRTTTKDPALRRLTSRKPSELFGTAFALATERSFPAAMWRMPGKATKHFVADLSGRLDRRKPDLEALPKGFLVSPFHPDERGAIFVKADLHLESGSEEASASAEAQRYGTPEASRFAELMDALANRSTNPRPSQGTHEAAPSVGHEVGRAEYETLVAKAVAAIKRGEMHKVVTSRTKSVSLPEGFRASSLFEALCRMYPTAFVSLVSLPGVGVWAGASPETLISQDADGTFKTMALAGTQAMPESGDLNDALWSMKEIEEQALVSRYVINCFKRIRLREFEEVGPRTVQAGHLAHLRTDFTVDTRAVGFPELGTVMIELLHPTSAVCGMPKAAALDFLARHERYDRGLYSGFLGPVSFPEGSDLFVNLRCVRLLEGRAVAYAGGGVTAGSDPAREWRETELKCDVTLRAIGQAVGRP